VADKRTYAADTTVPVGRSRGEIDKLLRGWGCGAISWGDDYDHGVVQVSFRWQHDGRTWDARISMPQPKGETREDKQRRRQLHRILLIKLKSDLNCVEAGFVSAAVVFLPYLVGTSGLTAAERLEHTGVAGLLEG